MTTKRRTDDHEEELNEALRVVRAYVCNEDAARYAAACRGLRLLDSYVGLARMFEVADRRSARKTGRPTTAVQDGSGPHVVPFAKAGA
jgi:hypothetical protein